MLLNKVLPPSYLEQIGQFFTVFHHHIIHTLLNEKAINMHQTEQGMFKQRKNTDVACMSCAQTF